MRVEPARRVMGRRTIRCLFKRQLTQQAESGGVSIVYRGRGNCVIAGNTLHEAAVVIAEDNSRLSEEYRVKHEVTR